VSRTNNFNHREEDRVRHYEDAFNMLCGKFIGQGIHRKVFECKIRPDLVVKVESDDNRSFANIFEMQFWDANQHYKEINKWLAPCEYLSPDGMILLQRKCSPVPFDYKLPAKLPEFLTDCKRDNFGIMDGKLVSVDYASTIINPSAKLKKADWF